MCGIAGVFSYRSSAPPVDAQELTKIRDSMAARGPDGAGLWISPDQRVGLAHRRLSIIDLSTGGDQPMFTPDRDLGIVFNGEIYNYRAIRKQLEAKGHVFRSASDTEVLLHAYAEYGESMVDHLRGMYAFAIWKANDNSLFLARDPFGIKPLYFSDDGSSIRFASQVKAVLQFQGVATSPEPAGHVGFLLWGHVPEPYTLYKGIRALEAGTTLRIDASGRKVEKKYFSLPEEIARASENVPRGDTREAELSLHAALLDSVRHHLIADVPVGVFLSAGLDSTTLAALAKEASNNEFKAITLGFKEFQGTLNDEVPLAELVAKHIGVSHSTRWVGKEEFAGDRQHLLDAMDQPTIDGVNSYFISKAASEAGLKVALSGLGGDELFGGYPSFRQVPSMVRAIGKFPVPHTLARGFRYVSAPLIKRLTSPKYAGLFEYGGSYGGAYLLRRGLYMPWELPEILDGDMVRTGWAELQTLQRLAQTTSGTNNSHLKVASLEMAWYMRNQLLRDTDWASMAHSLEVRVPLVDIELFRALIPMFNSGSPPTKAAMARASVMPLPPAILTREKTGFTIPVREWIRSAKPGIGARRGLRGWGEFVYWTTSNNKRAIALVTDGFGGKGGIAKFNRDLLTSCAGHPSFSQTIAFPRMQVERCNAVDLPNKLEWRSSAAQGKLKYIREVLGAALSRGPVHLIYCGHINLLPLAALLKLRHQCPLVLIIHGIDAWSPPSGLLAKNLISKVDTVLAVSRVTKERFALWSSFERERILILPNCVNIEQFKPRPRNARLSQKYGLEGSKSILTMGRLAGKERYKGFDEVLGVMPSLIRKVPNLKYVISGDGNDMPRLQEKARTLGIKSSVVFTGYVPEEDKIDLYNLCDAYVMPSRGEGFGIVFLEAMACGLPALGSTLDGSREALRDGELGLLVDPDDAAALEAGIIKCLLAEKPSAESVSYFSYENFDKRLQTHIDHIVALDIRP